jgi:hypothetical protein
VTLILACLVIYLADGAWPWYLVAFWLWSVHVFVWSLWAWRINHPGSDD